MSLAWNLAVIPLGTITAIIAIKVDSMIRIEQATRDVRRYFRLRWWVKVHYDQLAEYALHDPSHCKGRCKRHGNPAPGNPGHGH